MKKLKIKSGDTVSRVAEATGFAPETIWSHGENAELKEARAHMDVLAPGDSLHVPELKQRSEACVTDKRHRFRRKGVPMKLTVQLLDAWGAKRANIPYQLAIDGTEFEGETDDDGVLSEFIPNASRKGTLRLEQEQHDLIIGGMDPVTFLEGAQHRLTSLGFYCQSDNGEMGAATKFALRGFQQMMALEITGELDDATIGKLESAHKDVNTLADYLETKMADK